MFPPVCARWVGWIIPVCLPIDDFVFSLSPRFLLISFAGFISRIISSCLLECLFDFLFVSQLCFHLSRSIFLLDIHHIPWSTILYVSLDFHLFVFQDPLFLSKFVFFVLSSWLYHLRAQTLCFDPFATMPINSVYEGLVYSTTFKQV